MAQRAAADRQRRQCAEQGVRRKSASRAKYSGRDAGGAESATRERRRSAYFGRAHSGRVRQVLHPRRSERARRRSHFVGGRVEAKARCDGGDQLRRADAQHRRHGGLAPLGADERAGAQERHHGLGAGRLGVGNQAGAQRAGCAVRKPSTSDGAGGTNRRGRKNCDDLRATARGRAGEHE